jgi:hypothetical protein
MFALGATPLVTSGSLGASIASSLIKKGITYGVLPHVLPAIASSGGSILPKIGDGLEDVGSKIEDIAKDAGKGIVSAAKKVGSAFKKAFHFEEGGRVRRAPTTPPPEYRRGGKVKAIKHFNAKPRKLYEGGRVTKRRSMTASQLKGDSVRALLQPGELVIPVTHFQKGRKPVKLADLTVKALKRSGIRLPGT